MEAKAPILAGGRREKMAVDGEVIIVSKHIVRPASRSRQAHEESSKVSFIHLNPLDLTMIFMHYVQKGILYHKPTHQPIEDTVSSLRTSFTAAVDLFFPLAGRLCATNLADSSLSIDLRCNDEGAEFVHAAALSVTVSDILTPYRSPPIIHSFFALNGLLSYRGLHNPLAAAQVTELADGIFVAVSLNHAVADGTSFWHFFNAWSAISRGSCIDTPIFERWFPESCPPPYPLPFRHVEELTKTVQLPPVQECFLLFSAESIARLKSRANAEVGADTISSLQSLLAHFWRSVTRARRLQPEQETAYIIIMGFRSRIGLPQTYFGNAVLGGFTKATAGEVVGKGLGWAARLLNQAIARETGAAAHEFFNSWSEKPEFNSLSLIRPTDLATGSSPRFDVYGNDFGWGRPLGARSGPSSKTDGMLTVYPGPEPGSIGLEVCLSPKALTALLEDGEFMEAVC